MTVEEIRELETWIRETRGRQFSKKKNRLGGNNASLRETTTLTIAPRKRESVGGIERNPVLKGIEGRIPTLPDNPVSSVIKRERRIVRW
jgi:hypothetical protein